MDVMARTLADELRRSQGQPFVIENRAGAGGNIGAEYVAGQRPDCIVLGCTHFPLLAAAIKSVAGDITMVDSAATTALAVQKELARLGLLRPELADEREAESPLSRLHFLTTDAPQRFARVGSLFLGMELDPDALELVTL